MKRIKFFYITIIALFIGVLPLNSCKKVFEEPDASTFDEDDVFSSIENTRRLLFQMYARIPKPFPTDFLARLNGPSPEVLTDGASAFTVQAGYGTHKFNQGAINSSNAVTLPSMASGIGAEYVYEWADVREGYTIMERVDEIPNASPQEKQRLIAECKLLIANRYFEMFKRFGGVPIVRSKMTNPSEYDIPRSSLEETYNFIIGLLDEAIANPDFPAVTAGIEYGRMNKAFAYALKARVMLYAASPLFNTATPYIDFGANNNLICFGNYKSDRWKAAADAARTAINFCESNGYALVNKPIPSGSTAAQRRTIQVDNYITATERTPSQGNTEVIFSMSGVMANNGLVAWLMRGAPINGFGSTVPTHNQVERYRKTDGTFINWNNPIVTAANDPTAPYKDLEPRFEASIAYNGKLFYPGFSLQFYNGIGGGANGTNGSVASRAEFNYGMHKYVHGYENYSVTSPRPTWRTFFTCFRLAELYFILAEAENEFSGPTSDVSSSLNKVLDRSGMSVPVINTKEGIRDFIKRERAIEFYCEDHRYVDLKRWLNGPEGVSGNIFNIAVTRTATGVFTYTKAVQEVRTWRNFYYLLPFPQTEVNKNYGLIQNPGW